MAAVTMLGNAGYSIMQYRKYHQMTQTDVEIVLTADIKLEIAIALFLALSAVV